MIDGTSATSLFIPLYVFKSVWAMNYITFIGHKCGGVFAGVFQGVRRKALSEVDLRQTLNPARGSMLITHDRITAGWDSISRNKTFRIYVILTLQKPSFIMSV